ncbi:MAG: nicotinate-nucleotide adenylyltransferase [Oleiphilaceae bacterium]|nr:nicotinate-nucleotide adenylyltransferase [Oleiphilaceae bacterium]
MLHIVMGGTFDPVHHGHLRVAVELRERLGAGRIHLMPSLVPPHRDQPAADAEQRLAMLRLAVAGEPGLVVDERELHRTATSYSADTLRELRRELGPSTPIVLVMGMDAFAGLPQWHEAETIPQLAHVLVVARPDYRLDESHEAVQWLRAHEVEDAASLASRPAGHILLTHPPLLAISATGIRERVASGRSIRYLLPEAVQAYIVRQGLYRK